MKDEREVLGTTPKAIVFRGTKGAPLMLQGSELLGVNPSIPALARSGRYWDPLPIPWGCPRPNVRCLFVEPQGN